MENKDEGNESTENGENPGSYLKPVRIQVEIKNNLGFRFFLSEIQTFFISFIWVYGARFVSIYLYKTFFCELAKNVQGFDERSFFSSNQTYFSF